MANIPLMRNGKLVKSALDGVDVDKMADDDKRALHQALNKADAGKTLNADDLQSVVKARRTAPTLASDTSDKLAALKKRFDK